MAPFRWPKVENDIALLKEIVARRPSKADECMGGHCGVSFEFGFNRQQSSGA